MSANPQSTLTPRILTGVALLAVLSAVGRADDKPPDVSENSFREAAATFLGDPLKPAAKEAVKKITVFVVRSKDVLVVLNKDEAYLIGKEGKYQGLLATAYLAGSALSQLDSGVGRHDAYSGLIQVFRVYRAIKKQDKKYKVAEVEQLLKLHRDGKLMKHLLDAKAKRPKEDL